MIDFIFPLLGRFHPVLVHLPIGFLMFGVILLFWPGKKYEAYKPIVELAFLLGCVFAFLASVSGFLQYQHEGYGWDSVKFHLILGVLTTLLSGGFWAHLKTSAQPPKQLKIKGAVLFILLTLTGHLGGNITHGANYFTEVLPPELQALLGGEPELVEPLELPSTNWEEVELYSGAIQPILDQNCKSCHNPAKLKGELDLSSLEGIQKGGEGGKVLEAENPAESSIFTRLILPKDHDDHMPPKDKRQPRKEEIELIKTWIEKGASSSAKFGDLGIAVDLVEPFFKKEEKPFYPAVDVPMLAKDSISNLRDLGFFAEAVKKDSPLLKISCINYPGFSDSDWDLIQYAKDQIVYLDLSGTAITDALVTQISMLPNLTVLKFNNTSLEGKALDKLTSCKHLKLLYLNETKVSFQAITTLDGHPMLEKVFVYNTPAADSRPESDLSFLVETGNITLPPLPTDTIVY